MLEITRTSLGKISIYLLPFSLIITLGCSVQKSDAQEITIDKTSNSSQHTSKYLKHYIVGKATEPDPYFQISKFVRRIFQDKNGDLWFGTNGQGVIRYDGRSVNYYSTNEGFAGGAVRSIVEDNEGNVWFGTNNGLNKYDPTETMRTGSVSFTNFSEKNGLLHNGIWSMVVDSKGIIWIGTYKGVSTFDGETFTPFVLPTTESDLTRGVTSPTIVHSIMEDSKGQMWFGTNGGAFIYDATSQSNNSDQSIPALTQISEANGLCNKAVNSILEDNEGNIWFATHHNGVCRLNVTSETNGAYSFTHFTLEHGVGGTEVWNLYKDKAGNIWFPSENFGMYRYNADYKVSGKPLFTNFSKEEGLFTNAIQCTFEDKEGRLWLGGWMGLFRYDQSFEEQGLKPIFSVGKNGPWN
jgi:ligand-binding sensor domain-containing protein